MDKNTIVEYIEESPQNTNRAILNQMLDEFADTNGSGGTGADWEQSDPTAKDYVKNRTHYKTVQSIPIAENFKTEVYEYTYTENDYEYTDIRLTNRYIPSNVMLNSIEEIEGVTIYINGHLCEAKPTYEILSHVTWFLEKGMLLNCSKGTWSLSLNSKNPDVVIGEEYIININIEQVQYVPISENYLPETVKKQADWSCNASSDKAYIKNRTHYDYWDKESRIYDLPYTFESTSADRSNWLGDYGFMYNDCLFNSDNDWTSDGEEYDEVLEVWKDKYKCSQVQNEKVLTLKATTYYQWNPETDEYNHTTAIDCEGEDFDVVDLYTAKRYSKTIDKRFLPDFSVKKDWGVNDLTDPRYIKNRTHYSYLGQGKGLLFDEYDGHKYNDYNYLPYAQIVQSDLTKDDCSGYWLGRDTGYWINLGDPLSPRWSYLIDAYSDWKKISEEENNVTVYQHEAEFDFNSYSYILTVAVQPIANSSNEYNVELRNAIFSGETHFGVCVAEKMYKTLDIEYMPEGLPNNIDWNENSETSRSYIRNRPCYEKEIEYKTIFQNTITENSYYEDAELLNNAYQYRVICNGETIDARPTHQISEGGDYHYYTILTPSVKIQTGRPSGEVGSTLFATQGDFTAPYEIIIQKIIPAELKQLDDKFIPDTIARAPKAVLEDVTETPTAEQYNTLLAILRQAGILAT